MTKSIATQVEPPTSPGITIEFRYSNSSSFASAVKAARQFPTFNQYSQGKQAVYRVNFSREEIETALELLENLKGWRNRAVYLDGKRLPWDTVFRFVWCYKRRKSSPKPDLYCFGDGSARPLNLWGCIHAEISGAQWYTRGHWQTKRGDWGFDKKRIRNDLQKNLQTYQFCPALQFEFVERVIDALPNAVNPKRDKDWTFVESRDPTTPGIDVTVEDYGLKERLRMIGVVPEDTAAYWKILKRVREFHSLLSLEPITALLRPEDAPDLDYLETTPPDLLTQNRIYGRRSPANTKGKASYLNSAGRHVTIEQLTLEHYRDNGYQGLWSENLYWWQIMTLLYWDVIYARLPGLYNPDLPSFPSRMQDLPADMFTDTFYLFRLHMIEHRHKSLASPRFLGLQSPSPERELKSAWRKHKGKPCRFFAEWDKFSIEELALATKVLSHEQLTGIMDRLLSNFVNNRNGLPDLFLAKDEQPLFVEVKGLKERVMQLQSEWHDFLTYTLQIRVEICRVVEE